MRPTGGAAVAMIDDVWRAGDAALPLDPTLPDAAVERIAVGLGAHAVRDADGERDLGDGAEVPHGTALVVRTSGTTGAARGVMISRCALDAGVAASVDRLDAGAARWLGVLPVHHIAGLMVVLRARAAGTPPVLHDRFDAAAVAGATAATHVALVPTMLHRLLERGVDVGRFERILLGGAAPPPDLLARATAAGARVTVSYGMTETCGGCVYDGVPLDGVAVAIDPDERVLLRGTVLADGYRVGGRLVPLLDAWGWFRSRDVGRFDEGRLVVTGRSDDIVISGGVNVATTEVAAILRTHPRVADAAVIGVADAEWGQRVVAYVVATDVTSPPAAEDLRAHVRATAPAAMVPRQVEVVASLPRTALGKVDRGALRRRAGDTAAIGTRD
ncbi:MAG TPA: AMP-binding protein [Euzebyales bacterium]|nr:AMP-binding protein [Euzebyales bacterium]